MNAPPRSYRVITQPHRLFGRASARSGYARSRDGAAVTETQKPESHFISRLVADRSVLFKSFGFYSQSVAFGIVGISYQTFVKNAAYSGYVHEFRSYHSARKGFRDSDDFFSYDKIIDGFFGKRYVCVRVNSVPEKHNEVSYRFVYKLLLRSFKENKVHERIGSCIGANRNRIFFAFGKLGKLCVQLNFVRSVKLEIHNLPFGVLLAR